LRGEQYHRHDRHVIWSRVRKPGAFERYPYREELLLCWCSGTPTIPCAMHMVLGAALDALDPDLQRLLRAYEITRQLCEGLYRAHSHTPPAVYRDVNRRAFFCIRRPSASG
jgi:hypothetical protein